MEWKLLTKEDYVTTAWSGGTTTQLAIAPEGAVYADRDFLWRLSSATVDLEESDFTPLPDYDRLIAPLRGEMRLTHNGGPALDLAPCQVHAFDGADATHSWGRCTDFNLMLRKGACQGSVQALSGTKAGAACLGAAVRQDQRFANRTVAVYCAEGNAAVSVQDSETALGAGEAALVQFLEDQALDLAWEDGTRLMLAEIRF